jgi:hypothetical protein
MFRSLHLLLDWRVTILAAVFLPVSATGAIGDEADCPSKEAGLAGETLETTGVKGGLIVHVGCGDGKITCVSGK